MKKIKNILLYFVIFIIISPVFAMAADLLPPGLVMKDKFLPGPGQSVGKVQLVYGKPVIVHKNILQGYEAIKDRPLFKGDTIVTLDRDRINLIFNDASTITMDSNTKLIVTKSIYDPANRIRSSFLDMNTGKARFRVRKLKGNVDSRYKVKTLTALIGVRGSDFLVMASDTTTEVIASENTTLEIISLAAIEAQPLTLSEYQKVNIDEGEAPSDIIQLDPEDIEEMMEGFVSVPEVTTVVEAYEKGKVDFKFGVLDNSVEDPAVLEEPEIVNEVEELETQPKTEDKTEEEEEDIEEVIEEIKEDINEEQELPSAPGVPQV